MDIHVIRSLATGYANPAHIQEATSSRAYARGAYTSDYTDLPGETMAYPAQKFMRYTTRSGLAPTNMMIPLPNNLPLGETPVYLDQQGSLDRLKGKDMPNIVLDNRMLQADLLSVMYKCDIAHEDAPARLSEDYEGSPWMYGPRQGLPLSSVTNASNFVGQYAQDLSDKEMARRMERLLNDGYDVKHIQDAVKEDMNATIMKKLNSL